jgi:hypothetical protein
MHITLHVVLHIMHIMHMSLNILIEAKQVINILILLFNIKIKISYNDTNVQGLKNNNVFKNPKSII